MIRSFVSGFARSPGMTMKFGLLKYFLLPLRARKDKGNLPLQTDLFKQIFRKDSFTIIVLDACRYDVFKMIYKEYLQGELLKVLGLGTNTGSFLRGLVNMPEFRDVRIFASTPHLSKYSILKRWLKSPIFPPGLEIIDLWKNKWNESLGNVLPEEVNQSVFEQGLMDRNMIWYLPPHFPWIEDTRLSKDLLNEAIKKNKPLSEILANRIRKGETSIRRIKQLYVSNLRLSLCEISNLLKKLEKITDRVIVTSDHGELLGEYELFFHYNYLDAPELYAVPWLDSASRYK